MKFAFQSGNYKIKSQDCLVIGVFENGDLTLPSGQIDKNNSQFIKQLVKKGDFSGKASQTLMLHSQTHGRTLLIGCGKKDLLSPRDYRRLLAVSIKACQDLPFSQVYLSLCHLDVKDADMSWKIKQAVEIISATLYRFDHYKSQKASPSQLTKILFMLPPKFDAKRCENALKQGQAIADGVTLTKNLANMPSNFCTPTYLALQAKNLAKEYASKLKVKVLEKKDMEKLGMGALLAVAQGSAQAPKLICFEYNGAAKNKAPIAVIGKGITFDTGGISLKPADSMVGMKYDMCGAATVFGTIKSAAELKLPLNLVGIIAAAENMPSGAAIKPEDIVTTLSGQTVEIMNTDAEGRLVLCDALTYCERYKPAAVIDIATLTGAVVIALGIHATGLLSNDDQFAQELLAAGQESFDRAWQMPLWEEYQDQLKSPFADMSNVGGRSAGTITAACFLSRFAKKFTWAHLDVAGTAAMMMGGNDRYATGRPVPMLVQYLINQCTATQKSR